MVTELVFEVTQEAERRLLAELHLVRAVAGTTPECIRSVVTSPTQTCFAPSNSWAF